MAEAQQRIWLGQFGTSAQDFRWHHTGCWRGVSCRGADQRQPLLRQSAHSDAFLARFDRNGAMIWVRQFGAGDGLCDFAGRDPAGGVVVAGFTQGNMAGTMWRERRVCRAF